MFLSSYCAVRHCTENLTSAIEKGICPAWKESLNVTSQEAKAPMNNGFCVGKREQYHYNLRLATTGFISELCVELLLFKSSCIFTIFIFSTRLLQAGD